MDSSLEAAPEQRHQKWKCLSSSLQMIHHLAPCKIMSTWWHSTVTWFSHLFMWSMSLIMWNGMATSFQEAPYSLSRLCSGCSSVSSSLAPRTVGTKWNSQSYCMGEIRTRNTLTLLSWNSIQCAGNCQSEGQQQPGAQRAWPQGAGGEDNILFDNPRDRQQVAALWAAGGSFKGTFKGSFAKTAEDLGWLACYFREYDHQREQPPCPCRLCLPGPAFSLGGQTHMTFVLQTHHQDWQPDG